MIIVDIDATLNAIEWRDNNDKDPDTEYVTVCTGRRLPKPKYWDEVIEIMRSEHQKQDEKTE